MKSHTANSESDPIEKLRALCSQVTESATQQVAGSVAAVASQLAEPLRVVVAGGVSSGKSTLVNALIGRRVAAVDAGECTRVVTEFRYGHQETATAVDLDGAEHRIAFDGHVLPAELPVPVDRVDRIIVRLSNALLQQITIVDTPGVNTVTVENQTAAERALGVQTTTAMAGAEAVLFLTPHAREAEAAILERIADLGRDTGFSSGNCIAVLSKVDLLATEGDPMAIAARLVDTTRERLDGLVGDVVPLVGLLAETVEAARFTERDASTVAALAAVDDDLDREDMLLTAQDLLGWPGLECDEEDRRRLLDRLGLYGIRTAIELHDDGVSGAAQLAARLVDRSGFALLRQLLVERFAERSRVLKAHRAIEDLRRISYAAGSDGRRLRRRIERIELDPSMIELGLIDSLRIFGSADVHMPHELKEDLDRLSASVDTRARLGVTEGEDLAAAALAAIGRWSEWSGDPRRSPEEANAAHSVRRVLEQIWHETQESKS